MPALSHQQQIELVKYLRSNFNSAELEDLFFVFGLDPGHFGNKGTGAVARELVQLAGRHGKEAQLFEAIIEVKQEIGVEVDMTPYGYVPEGSSTTTAPATGRPTPAATTVVTETSTATGLVYENFDLRIRRKVDDGRYPIEVIRNPENIEMFDAVMQKFPEEGDENYYDFTDLVSYLEDLVARGSDAKELGAMMRQLLFPGEVWNIFFTNMNSMRRQGKGLRIRLQIDPPELSKLPWEYCYDRDFGFFALKRETPIVRYMRRPFESDIVTAPNPLKVLVAISAPSDQDQLNVDKEAKRIETIVNMMGDRVKLTVLKKATEDRIRSELLNKPHMFHFIGHGTVKDGQGVLVLEDKFGMSDYRDAEQMMVMMGSTGVKVVVLNACKTAAGDAHDAFSRMAPALVKAEIPAVIAMQFSVPDSVALGFTRDLYRTLMSGYPLDAAVTEMRIGAFGDDKYFWGIPSIYMRSPDGVLWESDEEMRTLFDKVQAAAAELGAESLPDLLKEISEEVSGMSEIDERDLKYITRGLDDAGEIASESNPDLSDLQRTLNRVIEDLRDSGSANAEAKIIPKVNHVLKLAEEQFSG